MATEGRYIYGFVDKSERKNFGSMGIDQGEVYTFPYEKIAAVVSDLSFLQFDALPKEILLRHLAVYQAVIEKVMKNDHIIPVKFGTVAQGQEELKRILEKGYEQIATNLKEMENKIELDVAALWSDLEKVLKKIGEKEEIKRLKEEAASKPADQLFEIKINLGKMVKTILDEKREECVSNILSILKKEAETHRLHDVMDDSMIMNSAFLIKKENQKTFELKVDQLDKRFNGAINFRMIGPLPSYSFNTLEIKKAEFGEINEARKMLALEEDARIIEIREAYKELSKKFHPDKYPGNPKIQNRFEKINKAYHILSDYCQEDRCSFKESDVREWMAIRPLEQSGTFA